MAAFTTIAAGVGLAATAGTTGMSFAQARKQRRLQQDAEDKAAQMMSEARKKLEVNYYDQLAIQKEPYELEREALISAGAQAIEAGKESERGAAAVAGRVQMAQQQGQRDIAAAMGQEMLGLEKLSAQEESRLRDVGIQLDLGEVEGAQMAAGNY
jgi:vacuolar-type H+-ATPase subunit H